MSEAPGAESLSEEARQRHLEALCEDPHLQELCESFARFFEGFGFKANLGRLWTVLFYSVRPLSQRDLVQVLGLSSGMVSQGLSELGRFGMVHSHRSVERRELLYQTEENLTKIASSILKQRERQIVDRAIEELEAVRLELAASRQDEELLHRRLQGFEEVLVLLQLSKSVLALFEAFSHHSYHAIRLASDALSRLRVGELLRWLGARRGGEGQKE